MLKNNKNIISRKDKNLIYFTNINKNKILKNIESSKNLNSIKSIVNIYKNLDTNVIFNTNKKDKKLQKINIDKLLKKQLLDDSNNGSIAEENNEPKKIINYNIPVINFTGENKAIINQYFNDIENENDDKNKTSANINENDNSKNNKNCLIF